MRSVRAEQAARIENRLADLDEGRSDALGSPISQRAFTDLPTVAGKDFFER